MKKKSITPILYLFLFTIFFIIYVQNMSIGKKKINMKSILLEKNTDFLKESTTLAVKYDIVSSIEDSIRFYSYSLSILNLSGDNNKLIVLDKIKRTAISGIDKNDLEKIKNSNSTVYNPVPIVFDTSLLSILTTHIYNIRKSAKGNYKLSVCMYFILPSNLYDSIALYNSSIVTRNPRFVCNDLENKSTYSENFFCNITLANFDPDGDIDHDGKLNKDDCDMDGDKEKSRVNIFSGTFCGGNDNDDNNDGLVDTLPLKKVELNGHEYYFPYDSSCGDFFSVNIENFKGFENTNPYYIFVMPFAIKTNDIKGLDPDNEFDYQDPDFFVYIAPIRIRIKVSLDAVNYNYVDLFLDKIWQYYNIGIYRETSECDGSPPGC
jgi:hypothetical protein